MWGEPSRGITGGRLGPLTRLRSLGRPLSGRPPVEYSSGPCDCSLVVGRTTVAGLRPTSPLRSPEAAAPTLGGSAQGRGINTHNNNKNNGAFRDVQTVAARGRRLAGVAGVGLGFGGSSAAEGQPVSLVTGGRPATASCGDDRVVQTQSRILQRGVAVLVVRAPEPWCGAIRWSGPRVEYTGRCQ